MTKKFLLMVMVLASWNLFSAELKVTVRDVMDLASYREVFSETIPLSTTKEVKAFLITKWNCCLDDFTGYTIQLKLEIVPIMSELTNDVAYSVTMIKELLLDGKVKTILTRDQFMLTAGGQKMNKDHYWSNRGLVVRQENSFSMTN